MKKEDLKNELLQNKAIKALEDEDLSKVSGGQQVYVMPDTFTPIQKHNTPLQPSEIPDVLLQKQS